MKWWRKLNLPHKCRVAIIDAEGNKFLVLPGDTVTVRGTTKHDLLVEEA